ncbi:ATP-binding protein [Pseudocolwellia sp. HL-MZ19]|uniref:ATP-binding protein n=1 Tax=unclassified Pseudocolwellia TaxID=2848178 RepID=UPI003CF7F9DC
MSIKKQLITLIISAVVLASFFSALYGYKSTTKQLDIIFDQELHSVATFVLAMSKSNQTLPSTIDNTFAFQVFKNGVLVSKSVQMPSSRFTAPSQYNNEIFFNGKRWRTHYLVEKVTQDTNEQITIEVLVAQPMSDRIKSAESILFVITTPLLFALPFIGLLIFYIINKSLKPLVTLSREIKNKNTDDLSEISLSKQTVELAPVVNRLNQLFARLSDSFDREKQLTANTAHELRTPISVLKLNAHNIQKSFENNNLTTTEFKELQQNVDRMAHVIEQIIALYRFTPENFNQKTKLVNLETVLQDVISNNFDNLLVNQQNISLEPANENTLLGDYFALYTLFENLLKNAIKYSGDKAEIKISIITNPHLEVVFEDSGPGISDEELPRIYERFYRVDPQQSRIKGSGLGLSIVKHITTLHNGEISCSRSSLGGLCVAVKFPLTQVVNS